MATCLLCKKDVTSGYVVCGDCAGKIKPETMSPVLSDLAAWLGENMAQNYTSAPCLMCEFAKSSACLNPEMCCKGTTAWLWGKVDEFLDTSACGGILGQLETTCPFPYVFTDMDDSYISGKDDPRNPRWEVGDLHADHDGRHGWKILWYGYWKKATAEMKSEMDRVYRALTANDALRDWTALRRFCWSHPEAQANLRSEDESNFYLVGEVCNFWIRLIAQPKECSLYLHMFTKDEETK